MSKSLETAKLEEELFSKRYPPIVAYTEMIQHAYRLERERDNAINELEAWREHNAKGWWVKLSEHNEERSKWINDLVEVKIASRNDIKRIYSIAEGLYKSIVKTNQIIKSNNNKNIRIIGKKWMNEWKSMVIEKQLKKEARSERR